MTPEQINAGYRTEMDVFGEVQFISPEYHEKYYALYTEVSGDKFCPSVPDKCNGCEQSARQYVTFIEVVFDKSTDEAVEATYHYNGKAESLSSCCLAELRDEPSGFYCTDCGEVRRHNSALSKEGAIFCHPLAGWVILIHTQFACQSALASSVPERAPRTPRTLA